MENLRTFIFSTKVAVGGTIVSGFFVGMAIILANKGRVWYPSAIAASISIIAAVLLWMHNRYAAHAWGFLAASLGVASLLLGDPNRHGILYWVEKAGYALILGAIAYWLFAMGNQTVDRPNDQRT